MMGQVCLPLLVLIVLSLGLPAGTQAAPTATYIVTNTNDINRALLPVVRR
jgi:hypothetical protein